MKNSHNFVYPISKTYYSMLQYITSLNNQFENKSALYNEKKAWGIISGISDLIIILNEMNHVFSQNDFNTFITLAMFKKTNSYISTLSYNKNNELDQKRAITIMFSQFTPDSKQMKKLFECYGNLHRQNYVWIDVLIKKNYNFTANQKQLLQDMGYDMSKFFSNKINLNLDDIKTLILSELKNTQRDLPSLKTLIKMNKIDYPNDFISWLINHLSPLYYKTDIYKSILDIFLSELKLTFDEQSYKAIYKFNSCQFVYYCIDNNFIPNQDFVNLCSKSPTFIEIPFYCHNKFDLKITTEVMNSLLKQTYDLILRNSCRYSHTETTKKLLDFGYSQDIIDESIYKNIEEERISIYKLCKLLGVIPNNETFKIAIEQDYQEIFDECTKIFKFLPDNTHLQIILKSEKYNFNLVMLDDLMCYKILPTKQDYDVFMGHRHVTNQAVLESLIKYGLKLDFDDIKKALKKGIEILHLERFNILYDETLYYWCYVYNTFPYDNLMTIDPHVLNLRKMCRNLKTTIIDFTKYIKENNVMPDKYCFDHACYYNERLLLDIIEGSDCDPTMTMYYWLGVKKCNFNLHFERYIELYNITEDLMKTKYDITFKEATNIKNLIDSESMSD